MSRSPLISIVTPSFNQAAFIREALDSVRQQSYNNVEHIVIDGGSTDDTLPILRDCARQPEWSHLHWISEPDNGQSHALNKGFARASGEIVGWLNSDDRYLPHCLEEAADAFQAKPDADVIYGDYRWIDEAGTAYKMRREIDFNPFVLLYHRVLYIPTTATFFRRQVFTEGNFLDESLHYALDFEFFVRLASRGFRFRHARAVWADFRFHQNSKTCSSPQKQLAEKRKVMESYSPFLRRLTSPAARRGAGALLSSYAAALRYSEKLLRGYYFMGRTSS